MEAGKIYWLSGDFKILNPDEPDCWDSVAKIDEGSWVISFDMIRFHTVSKDFGQDELVGFTINLQANKDDLYEGEAKNFDSGETTAVVTCELFENSKKFLLKGTWIESSEDGDDFFTWTLILEKKKN